MSETTPTAAQIADLLALRHSRDVFVLECKSGATWGGTHFRLDAWAMRRSYARPCTWGYEIKVTRRDFLGDGKIATYLPYCNELYLVAPSGIIGRDEVPEGAGLLETTKNGKRLLTRKKASYRDVVIPQELYWYILFTRCQITRDRSPERMTDFWRAWMAERDDKKRLGHAVSRKLQQLVEQRIKAVEHENQELKWKNAQLAKAREAIAAIGLTTDDLVDYRVADKLRRACQVVPAELIETLRAAERSAAAVLATIQTMQQAQRSDDDGEAATA